MHRRHSVWIDVFGIVALCALLLVPLGILATEVMDGGGRSGGGVASGSGGAAAPPRSDPAPRRSSRPARRSAPWTAARRGRSGASGSAVPFSKSWRERATPSLSDRAPASRDGGRSFGGGAGPGAPDGSDGRPAFGAAGGTGRGALGQRDGGASAGGAEWRREADRLAGRALALSGRLRAWQRGDEGRGTEETARRSEATSAAGTAASTSDNPPLPDPVPIDDHLHWLLVAGLLWGAWRIGRGT